MSYEGPIYIVNGQRYTAGGLAWLREQQRLAQIRRQQQQQLRQVRQLYADARALYDPEGDYMKGVEASIERGRGKAIAGGMQGLASAGLAGTSLMGNLSKAYEEEVAAPMRERAASERTAALAGLLSSEAQALMGFSPVSDSGSGFTGLDAQFQSPAGASRREQTTQQPLPAPMAAPVDAVGIGQSALPVTPTPNPFATSSPYTASYDLLSPWSIIGASGGTDAILGRPDSSQRIMKTLADEYFRYW